MRLNLDSVDMQRVLAEATVTVSEEFTDQPLTVTGDLPAALDGLLFRNGPGRFERGGVRYRHPFDGDGHVIKLDISGRQVRYSNRFVRTHEFQREERAGRMLYRAFGTNLPGGLAANLLRLRFKNAANTSIRWHAGRLLALWEGGPPYRLDPLSLETIGLEDFDGRLRNRFSRLSAALTPLLPFSAHPRIDSETGDLYNFGLVTGSKPRLLGYRIDSGGRMDEPRCHWLDRFSFVHDFAVTQRWICFLLPYADFDVPRALLGVETVVGSLRVASERPMQVLLLPRVPGAEAPVIMNGPPGFVFHVAQAFDDERQGVVLDVIRYGQYLEFDNLNALFLEPRDGAVPHFERFRLDPARQQCERLSIGADAEGPIFELPISAGGALGVPQRILYGIGAPHGRRSPYLTSIQRLDTQSGTLTSRDFGLDLVGEPMLVPGCDGEEGWLLTLVHRAGRGRSDLVLLRAEDLTVQATVQLPHVVPIGFHGCWVPRAQLLRPTIG